MLLTKWADNDHNDRLVCVRERAAAAAAANSVWYSNFITDRPTDERQNFCLIDVIYVRLARELIRWRNENGAPSHKSVINSMIPIWLGVCVCVRILIYAEYNMLLCGWMLLYIILNTIINLNII